MKKLLLSSLVSLGATMAISNTAAAAPQARSYQVTGPVVEVTDAAITVKKGEETWQVARDAGTKIDGELKVGAKVTVHYRMVATDVEVKADKPEKAQKPSGEKKK